MLVQESWSCHLPLRHWAGMSCTHGTHKKPSGVTSSDLSRYPPFMMQGIAQAILIHTPFRPHHLRTELTAYNPLWSGPLRTLRIDLQQHQPRGFRLFWILQSWFDWGSCSGMGEESLGKKIIALAAPWTTQVFDSIHKQEKAHPFSEDLLQQVRALICPASSSSCSPGQPFYLEHIQILAQLAEDRDRSASGCGHTCSPKPKHLAYQGRTQR